jgi:hypothetical protein
MDVFGPNWENYTERLKEGFSILTPEDTCVICGDLTWGTTLEDCLDDFKFIDSLPGKKIILKGNHDYWWSTATKAKRFFEENGITTIDILNNNCFFFGDTAICGTRGWFYDEETHSDQDKKIMNREIIRLENSLKAAGEAKEKICFFHYPPRFHKYISRELIALMQQYGVKRCYYGHIHGYGHRLAVQGMVDGIEYTMISADYVNFQPKKVV